MRALLAVSAVGLLATAVPAQLSNFLGFTARFDVSYTDRATANAIDADVLQVFRTRDYRHWCLNPTDVLAASHKIVGMRLVIQDQVGNTPENYTLVGYKDDPLNPGSPDIDITGAGIWFRNGPINTPPSTATGAVVITTIVGVNPAAIPHLSTPDTQDNIYLGIGLNSGGWPADGLGVHMAFDFNPGNTGTNSLDVSGPRTSGETNNFVVYVPTTGGGAASLPTGGVATYPAPGTVGGYRQLRLELLAQCTGGVAVTTTNQIRYPSSLPANLPGTVAPLGGTTNMLSGLHPDVNDATAVLPPPVGAPARADDFGFLVTERNRPNSLVVVRLGFSGLGIGPGGLPDGSLPLIFIPGFNAATTRGIACVDIGGPGFTFLGLSDANGVFQQMFGLNAVGRAALASIGPVDMIWQGFVVNLALSPAEVLATGCVTTHL